MSTRIPRRPLIGCPLIGFLLLAIASTCSFSASFSAAAPTEAQRQQHHKTFRDGNYKDAYEGFRKLALDPNDDPRKVGQDLQMGTNALRSLTRVNEIDEFREKVIKVHEKNWRLLWAAAQNYMSVQHNGFIVAGEFRRGQHPGGGRYVSSIQRDRIRALQLMVQALPLAKVSDSKREVSQFYLSLAQILLNNRGYYEAWRLQYLSDLSKLPDYEEGYNRWGWGHRGGAKGAPVDTEGKPVFHHVPKSFEKSETDGERWRWCLEQAVENSPALLNQVRMQFAGFLQNQFSVQTMRSYGRFFGRQQVDDGGKDESGTYALHTLGENETIAKLATGIKRFELPDEFNFIKIYQKVADDAKVGYYPDQALKTLAQIFENRRQYPKAADTWRRSIKISNLSDKQRRLEQIVGNWGRFERVMTQPAGKGATVDFRFRNGSKVSFQAHEIKVQLLLNDVKAYLKSNPQPINYQKRNISNIGYRLVQKNEKRYLGKLVAKWQKDLKPRPKHFDKRITVHTTLQNPGAYLVTSDMQGGNTSKIILWLSDTAIIKKPLDGKTYYFIADAVTGKPIAKANVEFFGYWQQHLGQRRYKVNILNFAEHTDKDGQIFLGPGQHKRNYQWIITARTKSGRFAYLGFTGVWYGRRYDRAYNQTKVFSITDRPVYRPKHTVKFKFWVRHAQYDKDDVSQFAGRTFSLILRNPKGETILTKSFKADEYGGFSGEYKLPEDATLGVYNMTIQGGVHGYATFRVEEYKKPEFEVTIEAPKEPVKLGDKITATIKAKYFFGSPVTEAKVKYKITRTSYSNTWYPYGDWDWLYGTGYWWFASDYTWYPGWYEWGCRAPIPWWWQGRSFHPPEIVAEREVEIGPDGTVKVEIDTAVAKELHGNEDHQYTITAEVVDASRRTIVGQGNVLAARKPFKVFAWLNRGFYRVDDTIVANFSARTLDNKQVQGKGKLEIFQITYDKNNKPVETSMKKWDLDTNDEGMATKKMKASHSGQFRLSYKLTDSKDHTIEGAYLFVIRGEGFTGADFRFNDLEINADKREYAPGDKVKLQINTNRVGSTVLLFARPTNGVYLPPKVLRLKGKSVVEQLDIIKKDMPNQFVEALTISGGKIYTQVKEIVVPPEKRVLKVEILPTAKEYKPGQKAKIKVKLTDFTGKPFVGSTVLAVYDKAVEYISGGSNIREIKAFFWKWRRRHRENMQTNLRRYFNNMVLRGKQRMGNLGIFGESVADEIKEGSEKVAWYEKADDAPASRTVTADAAAPALEAASAPFRSRAISGLAKKSKAPAKDGRGPGAAPKLVQAKVRKKFADTALWVASLVTNKKGIAEVSLNMPENLTAWKIRVWAMGHGTKVGQGETEVVTRKNLIIRMQAPRFFVEKDEVVLSANVHNYLKKEKSVQVSLVLPGKILKPMGSLTKTITVKPNGEARVDWRVKVVAEGKAVVRMKGLTDEESDAMEMSFPAYVHGMLKMDSYSGVVRLDEKSSSFDITVPKERRINESRLEVRYSPTLAGAMVDALPYLVDYPYGCTEQTLNRFLPTVITQKILIDMGLDLAAIQKKRTNLNAQEIGDDRKRAKGWKRYQRNPVFDQAEVQKMVKAGVQRLTEMQLSDGGWGWFSGWGERSYPHTTAYVVHGLQIAKQNDVALVPKMLDRGVTWLTNYQNRQVQLLKNAPSKTKPYKLYAGNLDGFVFMVLTDAGVKNNDMLEFLYRDRTKLAVYTNAMYGIALYNLKEKEKLAMIMKNISQFVVEDNENQTAYLKLPANNYWWYWYGSEYEAHAYYLKLLSRTDPKGKVAPGMVKYLLNNRKHATYWNSTRDTSLVIEAMAEYLKASGEDKPDMTVEVWMDGKKRKEVKITSKDLFTFDNKFVLFGDAVETGKHKVELRRTGKGPLYYNGYLTNFTLEDYITEAGLEVKVHRKFYKLERVEKTIKAAGARGQALDQKVEKYKRIELRNLATLKSGDLVEIELEIDSKNDYEYIIFEDMKAAGFETVEVRSGYNNNSLGAYMELRDNRVTFFVRTLARGKHSVSYRLRAEIPGKFSALPARAYAMYAPELKGNSNELKIKIED